MVPMKQRVANFVYQYHQEGNSYIGLVTLIVFVLLVWSVCTQILVVNLWPNPTLWSYVMAGALVIAGFRVVEVGLFVLCLLWHCSRIRFIDGQRRP